MVVQSGKATGIPIEEKGVLSLSRHDMIIYVENPMKSTKEVTITNKQVFQDFKVQELYIKINCMGLLGGSIG